MASRSKAGTAEPPTVAPATPQTASPAPSPANDALEGEITSPAVIDLIDRMITPETEAPGPVVPPESTVPPQETPPESSETTAEPAVAEDAAEVEGTDEAKEQEERPTGVQKRIDKLTRRLRETEEALETERQRVRDLEESTAEQTGAPTPSTPAQTGLEHLSASQIERVERDATELRDSIEDYLDGVADDSQRVRVERYMETQKLDETGLKRSRRELARLLERHIPARREFIRHQSDADAKTVQMFPWWNDRTSPEYQEAVAMLHARPEVRKWPDWKFALSVSVVGLREVRKQLEAKTGKPAASTVAAKPPPKVPTPSESVPASRIPNKESQRQAIRASVLDNPDEETMTRYFEKALQ
jgi:hypothetical protein